MHTHYIHTLRSEAAPRASVTENALNALERLNSHQSAMPMREPHIETFLKYRNKHTQIATCAGICNVLN